MAPQLLAMEPWKPDFVLGCWPIQKTIIWLRLPGLPLEFWLSTAIMAIAVEVGRPMAIDDFTDHLKKTRHAWVRVEIDVGKPLRPDVLI